MIDLPLPQTVLSAFLFLVGVSIGSFGNVVAWRLPRGESLLGRSRCPQCHKILGVIDLVPLLSYLWLQGRCRRCRAIISARYPLLEIAGGLAFVVAGSMAPSTVAALILGLALTTLIIIAVIDAETKTIPDLLTAALVVLALAWQIVIGTLALDGALVGLVFFGAQWLFSRGRWLGSGDIGLAAGIGLLLGPAAVMIIAIGASYIVGATVALFLLATGAVRREARLPFAPFLVTGTIVGLIFGPMVVDRLA